MIQMVSSLGVGLRLLDELIDQRRLLSRIDLFFYFKVHVKERESRFKRDPDSMSMPLSICLWRQPCSISGQAPETPTRKNTFSF